MSTLQAAIPKRSDTSSGLHKISYAGAVDVERPADLYAQGRTLRQIGFFDGPSRRRER